MDNVSELLADDLFSLDLNNTNTQSNDNKEEKVVDEKSEPETDELFSLNLNDGDTKTNDNKEEKVANDKSESENEDMFTSIQNFKEENPGKCFFVALDKIDNFPTDQLFTRYEINEKNHRFTPDDFTIEKTPYYMVVKFGKDNDIPLKLENLFLRYFEVDKKLMIRIFLSSFHLSDDTFKHVSLDSILKIVDIDGYDVESMRFYIQDGEFIIVIGK